MTAYAKLIELEKKWKETNKHMQKQANTIYAHYDIKSESSLAPNISYRNRTDMLEEHNIFCLNLTRCCSTVRVRSRQQRISDGCLG